VAFLAYLEKQHFSGKFFRWSAAHAPLHPMSNNGVESHNKDLEATVTNPGGAGRQRVGELIKNLFNFLRRKSILIDPTSAGYNQEYACKIRAVISKELYTKGEPITTNPNWVFAGPFINGPKEEYLMYSKNSNDSTPLIKTCILTRCLPDRYELSVKKGRAEFIEKSVTLTNFPSFTCFFT
jgi:hypothetical protein